MEIFIFKVPKVHLWSLYQKVRTVFVAEGGEEGVNKNAAPPRR